MVLKFCRRSWQCCLFVGLMLGSVSWVHAGSYEDFFSAIDRDDGGAVAALIERGFDANSRSPDGQSGLYLALQKDADAAVAAFLKAKELNVNSLNVNGESALMIAALKGHLEWTQKLLLRGAQVNKPGWTPLHYAATSQQPKVVSLLLDSGALIDAQSPNGTTALMMAARYGDEGNVRMLVLRQADARLKNQQDLDAAAFARMAGREALAKSIEQRYR